VLGHVKDPVEELRGRGSASTSQTDWCCAVLDAGGAGTWPPEDCPGRTLLPHPVPGDRLSATWFIKNLPRISVRRKSSAAHLRAVAYEENAFNVPVVA